MIVIIRQRVSSKPYCKKQKEKSIERGRDRKLLDLNSSELEITLDLKTSNVVRVAAMSEGSEAFSIDEDLKYFFVFFLSTCFTWKA